MSSRGFFCRIKKEATARHDLQGASADASRNSLIIEGFYLPLISWWRRGELHPGPDTMCMKRQLQA